MRSSLRDSSEQTILALPIFELVSEHISPQARTQHPLKLSPQGDSCCIIHIASVGGHTYLRRKVASFAIAPFMLMHPDVATFKVCNIGKRCDVPPMCCAQARLRSENHCFCSAYDATYWNNGQTWCGENAQLPQGSTQQLAQAVCTHNEICWSCQYRPCWRTQALLHPIQH